MITRLVDVSLSDIINHDLEGFLDLLSEKATGTVLLMDIQYEIIEHRPASLTLKVTGDDSMIQEAS